MVPSRFLRALLMLSVVVLLLCVSGNAWAVSASDTSLPFDAAGQRVHQSATQTWIPLIVFGALVACAVVIIAGRNGISSLVVRTLVAIGFLAVATTGAIVSYFPGLVTTLTLP